MKTDGEAITAIGKMEEYVAAYRALRDKRAELKKAYEEKDRPLKDKMDEIAAYLTGALEQVGATSMKTPAGSVRLVEKQKAICHDWAAFHAWVEENHAAHVLHRRISVKDLLATCEQLGTAAPAVTVETTKSVTVTKPRS